MGHRRNRREFSETLPETPAALAIAAQLRRPEDLDRVIDLLSILAAGQSMEEEERNELMDLLGALPMSREKAVELKKHLEDMVDRRPGWE